MAQMVSSAQGERIARLCITERVPDETQSPSSFTHVPMLPLSVVGDRAGKTTTVCARQSLAGDACVTERASVEGACTSADAMEAAAAAVAVTEQKTLLHEQIHRPCDIFGDDLMRQDRACSP